LVYLDVCCLNRPFDDQHQDRIRLESEAILTILFMCEREDIQLVESEVTYWEVDAISNFDRKECVLSLLKIPHIRIVITSDILARGKELETVGFGGYDALHLACAEAGKVDVFLTVDDGIISKVRRNSGIVKVDVMNPVTWFMERTWRENANNDPTRN
jgi:predicted nucleic acid-binding protein